MQWLQWLQSLPRQWELFGVKRATVSLNLVYRGTAHCKLIALTSQYTVRSSDTPPTARGAWLRYPATAILFYVSHRLPSAHAKLTTFV